MWEIKRKNIPPSTVADSFLVGTLTGWVEKTLAEVKIILGASVPTPTAENDVIMAGGSPIDWVKKTIAEAGTAFGLVLTQTANVIGFSISGGTTSKMLTVTDDSSVSGTNTGDETESTIKTKLGITTLSGSNTGDEESATTSVAGVVELATNEEALTGTDTERAITSDDLKYVLDSMTISGLVVSDGTLFVKES